jgi:GDPmannose 4,6-dehydratase
MKRCAVITGVGGQDGSYLADLLISKGYMVFGMTRRNSTAATLHRIQHIMHEPSFKMYYGDVTDLSSIIQMLQDAVSTNTESPIEVYHLAAQSHVQVSFETPIYTAQTDAIGTLNVLEAVRRLGLTDKCRIYQASTSELFGSSLPPQNEDTPFQPRSPYAISKLYGYWIVRNYREAFGMYAVNGILFNHESERRGEEFVSRKVTKAVARYVHDTQSFKPLRLGNLYAKRDWGYAPDYVYGMWRMLQEPKPADYVLATGTCHTVKDLITIAFGVVDVKIRWEGTGVDEKGYDATTNRLLIEIDPHYFRLTEVNHLEGDASFARETLGWECHTCFEDLVKKMVDFDLGSRL